MQINSVLSVLIIALTVILIIAFTKKPSSWWNIPLLAPIRVRGLPIILSYFTKGYDVLPVQNAAYKNYRYRFILTTLPKHQTSLNVPSAKSGIIIYTLELPYQTSGHILGVSKKSNITSTLFDEYIKQSHMDRVDLEGDYPNTFDLYAGKEQASITQYMLDPEAMEYTVQYCQNFIWEIVDSTMYIISATTHILPEDTLERSVLFAEQIKPALASAVKIRSKNVNNLHGGYYGDSLKCPLCESSLIIDGVFQVCPNGHGILLLAADLIKLGKARLQPPTSQKYAGQSHGIVICPYCSQKMTLVDYQARGIIIDSCTQCPFRWLDAHEAYKIAHPSVKLPPFATITT